MKGSHRIVVQNKRIRYDFEVKRNITVIRGDSATGKTTLVDMIREHFENGSASGVELTCDKECTVLEGRTWAGQLSMMRDCIVFIDEGNDFVASNDFAAIQDTDNYYVIVTREGIPFLPYGVEEIYGIRNSGKYGTLKRTYNEFYHLYQMTDFIQTVKPKKVITEDSNSGFQFFHSICVKGGKIRCISAQGKSNIFAHVADTLNEKILVVADGAAFGSEMENGDPSLILPIPRADSFSSRFIRLFFQNRPICCHILE
ncbi:MAG: translation initiation factor 2 [Lachnospiraceae bacterium]|nr:translation initiation factor 2 [Lachnospiraceae bacterium]